MHSCPLLVPDSHPSVSSTTTPAMLFKSSFFSCFSSLSVLLRSLCPFILLHVSSKVSAKSSIVFALLAASRISQLETVRVQSLKLRSINYVVSLWDIGIDRVLLFVIVFSCLIDCSLYIPDKYYIFRLS